MLAYQLRFYLNKQPYMRVIKSIVISFALLLSSYNCFAETVTGCRLGNDDFLYTGYNGVQPYPVSQWYVPEFPTYTTPKKDFLNSWYTSYNNCPYFANNPTYGAQCAIQGITYVSGGEVKNLGQTITYTLTYDCPLDDYTWALLLLVGGLGVVVISKRI